MRRSNRRTSFSTQAVVITVADEVTSMPPGKRDLLTAWLMSSSTNDRGNTRRRNGYTAENGELSADQRVVKIGVLARRAVTLLARPVLTNPTFFPKATLGDRSAVVRAPGMTSIRCKYDTHHSALKRRNAMAGDSGCAAGTEIGTRLTALWNDVDETCNDLGTKADSLERNGRHARAWDLILRSVIAILAVASPALVTYSTTQGIGPGYRLAAILLTGVAGAATTLQAIFALGSSYARSVTTALSLRQLIRDLRRDADTAFRQEDKVEAIGKIRSALDAAGLKSSEILWSAQRAQIAEYRP
jgi:hypothetical protein